ncbi:NAD-dependent succinate-semialdehyde dehydrogenase [Oceaniglobus trochenteri]|uniref:NAD-dependent succinate-semialdehyde dehydrogenase n=1 Tax=Oceaniglobus trochenteri TaxID=2763260 RepID=UPI001D000D4C|nr:NAD-dependent succinate-semialdehyde dehydrogenase [Oceaniglobus trochenteri]
MTNPYEPLELLIDGAWTAGTSGRTVPVLDPATGQALGALPLAAPADLDRALAAAERGFQTWRKTPPIERQRILEGAARLLDERLEPIARNLTRDMGKPLAEAWAEMQFAIDVLRWYAEEGKRMYGRIVPARVQGLRQMVMKEPVGPVLAFVAWNFPANNVMRKVAGALGAGCSIIIKPSEETPSTAIAIARALQDAGLPDGVLNVVFGDPAEVSAHLIASPVAKKVSFTGSVEVGKHLQKLAADTLKRCTLELGGHAPVLVFADADVERAAKQSAAAKFRNAGQVCIAPSRFLVERAAVGRFTDAFVAEAEALRVGHGLDDGVTMGPLIGERRIAVMEDFVSDAVSHGAKVLTGGARIGNQGCFFAPTVLGDVIDAARIMNEEPFGPVAPISAFDTLDEAITRANRLPFGLAAYAFARDAGTLRALSDGIEAGMVGINSPVISTPETPFGGIGDSGYGSEGGIEGLEVFTRTRLVTEMQG